MEVSVWVQHMKYTKRSRTYEGKLGSVRLVLELADGYFKEGTAPAEIEVVVKTPEVNGNTH